MAWHSTATAAGSASNVEPAEPATAPSQLARGVEGEWSAAAGVVMQMYWSAVGRAWSLSALAARTEDEDEQQALGELLAGEEARRDLVGRLLTEVWHITV